MKEVVRQKILPHVQHPSRYLGNEWNAVHKDWEKVKVKMAFAFPDLYEVGMSHLGLAILYGLVNSQEDYLMERAFAPAPDMEAHLRAHHLPLFSLESWRPLREFDLLGFTLQYEMNYTNVLNMLDLARIPLEAAERKESDPLVVGGGPCTINPEPLAPFFDFFVLGEGEEVLLEILARLKELKGKLSRREILRELAKIPGVYVPGAYEVNYHADGTVKEILPKEEDIPPRVRKRVVADLDAAYFPEKPLVPFMETVHDRAMLEIMRGCSRGCRFCQAGIYYRPVRERRPATLERQALEILKQTGHEEISLTSLSSTDYSQIAELLARLTPKLAPRQINISLPSLRIDTFSVALAEELQKVRRAGLTFAPEAGTQRLRNVINKTVTEEEILATASAAFKAGWQRLKLYFMLGLPTETLADLAGIAELCKKILALAPRRAEIEVSVSAFVPKAQTPFQWEVFEPVEVVQEKQRYLRAKLRQRGISYHWHDARLSFLEAVFARGDRRLAAVLKRAWRLGCRFDGWQEHFNFEAWMEAFREEGIDPGFYASRPRPKEEVFPWDHLDFGVSKKYLWRERERARKEETTPDCRQKCQGCGVCRIAGKD